MKKLIALLFCLAVMATVARAEYPKTEYPQQGNDAVQEKVSQQVDISRRTAQLEISAVGYDSKAKGKAILMGFTNNYKQAVFMATRDLNNEVVSLGADELYGAVASPIKAVGNVDYRHVNLNGANLIKITMPVKLQGADLAKAKKFAMITDAQAVNMAKAVQGKDDKALEEYRKGIIDTGRRK